jgi:hypothetical protein
MRAVELNELTYPFTCCGCHSGNRELKFIALDIFVEGYGDLFLCENCLNSVDLLLERGLVSDQKRKIEELEAQVEHGNLAVTFLNSIKPIVDQYTSATESQPTSGSKGTKKLASV